MKPTAFALEGHEELDYPLRAVLADPWLDFTQRLLG